MIVETEQGRDVGGSGRNSRTIDGNKWPRRAKEDRWEMVREKDRRIQNWSKRVGSI